MFEKLRRAGARTAAAPADVAWLLLVAQLPVDDAAARMKVLRTFESLGAALLREGAYLLPESAHHLAGFQTLADYVKSAGGDAWLMRIAPVDPAERAGYLARFDRSERYAELEKDISALRAGFGVADPGAIARVLGRQRDAFDALVAIDFFPTAAKQRVGAVLDDLEREVRALCFPETGQGSARVEKRKSFFRKNWATRRPLSADRLASAWLIRRFIDPEAQLIWLDKSQEAPAAAIGFAYPGAKFANSRNRVTYEELMHAFGLQRDAALVRIGVTVHALESGDLSVAEASGVETMLAGARRRTDGDDALLAETEKTFDLLYDRYFDNKAARRA